MGDGGVETGSGDSSETGTRTGNQKIYKQYRCQSPSAIQGLRGEQQRHETIWISCGNNQMVYINMIRLTPNTTTCC